MPTADPRGPGKVEVERGIQLVVEARDDDEVRKIQLGGDDGRYELDTVPACHRLAIQSHKADVEEPIRIR
jgi:hypothetical protein